MLVHEPLLQILWQFGTARFKLAPFNEFLLLSAVSLPVILVVSYGFFLFAEKPFMSFKNRRALAK